VGKERDTRATPCALEIEQARLFLIRAEVTADEDAPLILVLKSFWSQALLAVYPMVRRTKRWDQEDAEKRAVVDDHPSLFLNQIFVPACYSLAVVAGP
jgi:hypothetical protein